jgi:PAS domain S-box-containing protein
MQRSDTVAMGKRSLCGAIVALGLLLGAGGLAYRSTTALTTTQWWVAHTHDVLDTIDAVVGVTKDNAVVLRGFLVTGETELIRRRELNHPALSRHLDHLRDLVADHPEQRDNVAAFDGAIRAKLAYTDDMIRRHRDGRLGAAELHDRLAEGLRRMDEIGGHAARIQHVEHRLLALREAAVHESLRRTLAAVVGGTLLGVALLVGILAILSREIGERRRIEEALRMSEGRLTLALDASQMGLWDLDLTADRSYRTLRHDQIFGYDALQPMWGREAMLRHVYPPDLPVEQAAFEAALATGDFRVECRIVRHGDAAIRWIASRGKLFRDAAGEPVRMMGSVMDVTERKDAEARLQERTLQLEAANESLGSFTYSVSHDLRAPLRAIDGYAHILVEDHAATLNDESRRVLDVIRTNARQMGRLIDDLLAFSRLGRAEPDYATTDLAGLAGSVVAELRRQDPTRAVDVTIGDLAPAVVDAAMMRQAFFNLIGNAWKFTRDSPRASIEIGCTPYRTETVYWIRDNGAGFDMQFASKLFRVFERLHRADEFDGTGVGLAIVQRVVQRHGGRIWADAAPGEGATFFVALPHEKGARHGTRERGDSVGGGQPGGRRAGGTSAQEA